MSNEKHERSLTSGLQPSYLTTAYTELCRTNQALHDFRMKLLSLLPIASVAGLLALGKSLTSPQTPLQPEVGGYIGIFSGLFTLALFGYEVRSLLMCHDLYLTGADLELKMAIEGQFTYCNEEHEFACYDGAVKRPLACAVNDKITSCLVYSLVFAAWFWVGLRYLFDVHPTKCVYCAFGIGVLMFVLSSQFLRVLTTPPKRERNHAKAATA